MSEFPLPGPKPIKRPVPAVPIERDFDLPPEWREAAAKKRAEPLPVVFEPAPLPVPLEPPAAQKLVACPDCRCMVSRRAAACPGCGAPMAAPKPQLVEQTAKRFKAVMLIGGLGMLFGIIGLCAGQYWGAFVAAVGICLYAGGRMSAWWHHG